MPFYYTERIFIKIAMYVFAKDPKKSQKWDNVWIILASARPKLKFFGWKIWMINCIILHHWETFYEKCNICACKSTYKSWKNCKKTQLFMHILRPARADNSNLLQNKIGYYDLKILKIFFWKLLFIWKLENGKCLDNFNFSRAAL